MATTARAPEKPDTPLSEARSDLSRAGAVEICGSLRLLLADVFGLYLKTKNFHWHMSGGRFLDHHLLLEEQAQQIFAMTDFIAERARTLGGFTLRSISDISRHQRLKDNNEEGIAPKEMLLELRADNMRLTRFLRATHEVCQAHDDIATASLIEIWVDQAEHRTWFLSEIVNGL
jgi:starvation-inducible DNA-binding protein